MPHAPLVRAGLITAAIHEAWTQDCLPLVLLFDEIPDELIADPTTAAFFCRQMREVVSTNGGRDGDQIVRARIERLLATTSSLDYQIAYARDACQDVECDWDLVHWLPAVQELRSDPALVARFVDGHAIEVVADLFTSQEECTPKFFADVLLASNDAEAAWKSVYQWNTELTSDHLFVHKMLLLAPSLRDYARVPEAFDLDTDDPGDAARRFASVEWLDDDAVWNKVEQQLPDLHEATRALRERRMEQLYAPGGAGAIATAASFEAVVKRQRVD